MYVIPTSSMERSLTVGLVVGIELGERSEIVEFRQHGRRFVHATDVQRHVILPREVPRERILVRLDEITILPLAGVETGMGAVGDGRERIDRNVARQHEIELAEQLLRLGDGLRNVEMRHVIRSVDARVGAPGPGHLDGLAQQGSERLLQGLLDGGHGGLPLPTEVSTAVVTEFEEITHGRSIYNEVKIRIKPGLQTRYSEKNS